jgi:hypothetical protein
MPCGQHYSTASVYDGRNQWVQSLVQSTIKHKSWMDQEIQRCFKAGSSDQEQILAIKNFDRRHRWKLHTHYSVAWALLKYSSDERANIPGLP